MNQQKFHFFISNLILVINKLFHTFHRCRQDKIHGLSLPKPKWISHPDNRQEIRGVLREKICENIQAPIHDRNVEYLEEVCKDNKGSDKLCCRVHPKGKGV